HARRGCARDLVRHGACLGRRPASRDRPPHGGAVTGRDPASHGVGTDVRRGRSAREMGSVDGPGGHLDDPLRDRDGRRRPDHELPPRGGGMTNWILLRAAGIGAYVMLFLSVAWGLLSTTSIVTKRASKPSSTLFHQFVATVGVVLLGVHMVLLVIDSYMPFAPLDVLIPQHSTFRPLPSTPRGRGGARRGVRT